MKVAIRDKSLTFLGFLGIVGFLSLYAVKLFGQHGKPRTSVLLDGSRTE